MLHAMMAITEEAATGGADSLTGALSPEPWLNLGIAGGMLFIVLVIVVLLFKQQGSMIKQWQNSTNQLCGKIESLVVSFSENNLQLSKVTISYDKDHKEVLRYLAQLNELLQDTHRRTVRIDTRLYLVVKKGDEAHESEYLSIEE